MTTKEFIKMLQEADPSGEAHIRMPEGGSPSFVELKEAYWDGPYSHIDADGNYVYTTKGMKVDIHNVDIESFVEKHVNIHDPNNWENVKSKFKFDLGYAIEEQRKEREDSILNFAKEWYDEIWAMEKRLFEESEDRGVKHIKEGWTFFQNKLVDDDSIRPNFHHYYTWKIYDVDGNEQSSNLHDVQGVYKSNKFERHDNNKKSGYYEWKLKN